MNIASRPETRGRKAESDSIPSSEAG